MLRSLSSIFSQLLLGISFRCHGFVVGFDDSVMSFLRLLCLFVIFPSLFHINFSVLCSFVFIPSFHLSVSRSTRLSSILYSFLFSFRLALLCFYFAFPLSVFIYLFLLLIILSWVFGVQFPNLLFPILTFTSVLQLYISKLNLLCLVSLHFAPFSHLFSLNFAISLLNLNPLTD